MYQPKFKVPIQTKYVNAKITFRINLNNITFFINVISKNYNDNY